jgi:hypothetical protein
MLESYKRSMKRLIVLLASVALSGLEEAFKGAAYIDLAFGWDGVGNFNKADLCLIF